ncbi:plasmid replication/partition related protein [uncultured Stenotrophomonas sp.]|uniref:plasmid replication/partition related protein n=1 Tax=uncultured Stenotrophomonas sp. TaxID=165438 RepID=UPI0025DAEBB0|nr:plasmid replication/partition related protein [uncultured Stenotrophomonas sp.]
MDIIVNEELKAYIDPLTQDEHDALERSLLAEGCRDALVLWGDVLIDGHNRYGICSRHGIPFNTVQNTRFKSMDDVHLWMIEQHLGRRSVSDYQRGVLALRKRDILETRRRSEQEQLRRESEGEAAPSAAADSDSPPWDPAPKLSKADLAREAKLSPSQVTMIEKIHDHATAEVIEAMRVGAISLSAAATVASLPEDEQRAAARGGKDELKQAAKRVRDAKRKPKAARDDADDEAQPLSMAEADGLDGNVDSAEVQALRQRVASLTAENQALRMELDALRARMLATQAEEPIDA